MIELIFVILIISILIGMIIGLSRRSERAGNVGAAIAELGVLHHALNDYHLEHDRYPESSGPVTNIFPDLEKWLKDRTDGIDPWGREYPYEHDREKNPHVYELYSYGPIKEDVEASSGTCYTEDDVYFKRNN